MLKEAWTVSMATICKEVVVKRASEYANSPAAPLLQACELGRKEHALLMFRAVKRDSSRGDCATHKECTKTLSSIQIKACLTPRKDKEKNTSF